VDLSVEQKTSDSVSIRDPAHVFARGDLVRFHVKSQVNGFLYVINQASSGKFQYLSPSGEAGANRRLTAGKDRLLPDPETGWFKIEDPPGYDTVYFLISPVDLGKSLAEIEPGDLTSQQRTDKTHDDAAPFSTATPRCDDELFRARGECLDSQAGVKPLQRDESLPKMLPHVPASSSRDLITVKDSKDISISSSEPFDSPSIYRLRIAHK